MHGPQGPIDKIKFFVSSVFMLAKEKIRVFSIKTLFLLYSFSRSNYSEFIELSDLYGKQQC
mgnify:FL=1